MIEEQPETVFDPIRQHRVKLTPEERVRQAMVYTLVHTYGYPPELIANEVSITVGKVSRRCDTVVYSRERLPLMILEYKAPSVPLTQEVITQAFQYNSVLRVPFIVITNSLQIAVYRVGYDGDKTKQLPELPGYRTLINHTS